jgi:WD40 repeat protein
VSFRSALIGPLAVSAVVAVGATSSAVSYGAERSVARERVLSPASTRLISFSRPTAPGAPFPSPPPLYGDEKGYSVAVSGRYEVVGAPGMASETGIAYIYERSGTHWTQEAVLKDPYHAEADYYAWAVAISSTKFGTYVAVGGYDNNGDPDRVYIYEGSGKTWHRQKIQDNQSSDMFGDAIAISGTTLAVSASCTGSDNGTVYLYERFKRGWKPIKTLNDPGKQQEDFFGQSLSVSGNEILIGAVDKAYLFSDVPEQGWVQTAAFQNPGTGSDNFGLDVALNGTTALIGAPGPVPYTAISPGSSMPMSAGAAYVYTLDGTAWSLSQKLAAPPGDRGEEFGHSVAMTSSNVLIGMPVAGRVDCGTTVAFELSNGKWTPNGQIIDAKCTNGDQFGFSVSLSGAVASIGAPDADSDNGANVITPPPPPVEHTVTVLRHGGTGVAAVAFNPAGNLLASGDVDGDTYLWDVKKHAIDTVLRDPNRQSVYGVAFSPNGRTLAVGTTNLVKGTGVVYLWNIATHKVIATLSDPGTQGVDTVAFSPGGNVLASGDNNGSTYLWNIRTRKLIARLRDPGGLGVNIVTFNRDGQILAAADNNGYAYLWDVGTRKIISGLHDPNAQEINGVCFTPSGRFLAVADSNGNAYLWNVSSHKRVEKLPNPTGQAISDVAFSPTGLVLAGTTSNPQTHKSGVLLWGVVSNLLITTLYGPHSLGDYRLAYNRNGNELAVGDANGSTYLWETSWLQ